MGRVVHILLVVAALITTVCLFEFTSIDLVVERQFYDHGHLRWLLDRNAEPFRFVLYDGFKRVLYTVALCLLVILLFFRKSNLVKQYRHGFTVLLLSLILVPAFINFLKAETHVPCPRNLSLFDGNYPYVTLFTSYPKNFSLDRTIRCYPAGHASGGFALMALFFLFKRRRHQYYGLMAGLGLGWVTGFYKMLIGDHFLSHTVVSMLIAWCLILVIEHMVSSFLYTSEPSPAD